MNIQLPLTGDLSRTFDLATNLSGVSVTAYYVIRSSWGRTRRLPFVINDINGSITITFLPPIYPLYYEITKQGVILLQGTVTQESESNEVSWGDIQNKPETFPSDITLAQILRTQI